MLGVGLVLFCCVMFIHLGLGETFIKIMHFDFVLFRCVKCLTFWGVLTYSFLIVKLSILESVALGFAMSYTSLWIDLILSIIACKYDYLYTKTERQEYDYQ